MTRPDLIRLVDDLIKESDACTIREYLDTVAEIDGICAAPVVPLERGENRKLVEEVPVRKKRMGRPRKCRYDVEPWQVEKNELHLKITKIS